MGNGGLGGYNSRYGGPTSKFCKISGYVKKIFCDERMIYLSCPVCRKKVFEESTNKWKCETCNKVHDSNIPTYMFTAIIADLTGDMFVQFTREFGDPIMNGMSAVDFKTFRDENEPEVVR